MSISEQYLLMTWSKSNQFLGRSQYKGCPHCGEFSSLGFFTGRANQLEVTTRIQRFRVRHGLSCMIGPVWPVGDSCYSQAALPMPLSKLLYVLWRYQHLHGVPYEPYCVHSLLCSNFMVRNHTAAAAEPLKSEAADREAGEQTVLPYF